MKKNKNMNKKSKKVLKIVVPIAIVVVVLGSVVIRNLGKAGEAVAEAMAVETMTVETGDVTETIETSGIVVSGQQKVFFSPVNAVVKTADFQVGDLVEAGDKLIEFNQEDLEEQNQKAKLIEEGKKGISAEFKGVISDSQVVEGATVSQGMQLFTLQSIDDVNVDITLSKSVYEKVKEGQKATITFAGHTYEGTVTRISRIATSSIAGSNQAATSTAITATVHIDNPDDNIFLGVEAKVSIQAAEAKNVVILPTEAVNIGKDGSFCWVCEDGVLTKRSIETGVTGDECMEITKGLEAGEEVITNPGSNEEGDAIVIEDTDAKEK